MSRDDFHAELTVETGYNNAHRAFLQAFLSRPVMTVDEIKPVLAAVHSAHDPRRPMLEGDVTPADISSTITTINTRLSALDYEIRSTRSQTDRTLIYALVNTTSDALTQLATTFSPDEISYIKRILDAMFETYNTRNREIMAVSKMQASNLAKVSRSRGSGVRESQVNGNENGDGDGDGDNNTLETANAKSLTISEADRVLSELLSQSFLHLSRAQYYSLAPRAFIELRTYLKETYNEPADPDDPDDEPLIRVKDCEGCREIVTVGQRCADRACGCRLHDHCTQQFFRGQNQRGGRGKCPVCKVEWTGDVFVGERVVVGSTGARRGGGNGGRSSSSAVGVGEDGGDEDEDEEE
ncbi:uncharacterized protein BDR25DRAFT_332737 [Lindgomyces ingoldianus]|uniref:Uncharacterized protein n=1 Tax=Lindgomyces ingoldianus TaxID=673940 RepID=A0ACB6R1B7_9PLEO|nr:uncharacterized protein BDR25DRAFT_332737 [Lindgomyces ingoldianus]KAF2473039.1 hypothetical protein BDR25DRAFT_332737 [Lindgomyces ingoldianus]